MKKWLVIVMAVAAFGLAASAKVEKTCSSTTVVPGNVFSSGSAPASTSSCGWSLGLR